MQDIDNSILEIVKEYDNITYLNMDKFIIGNTKFIGCSLWSDVSEIKNTVANIMNDYSNIYLESDISICRKKYYDTGKRKYIKSFRSELTPDDIITLHNKMKFWLNDEINSNENYNIIVLSHHPPSFKMSHKIDDYKYCYGSECENLIKYPVKYWISGHTHKSMKIEINNIPCISNCMGYPGEFDLIYDPKAYIEFN